MPKAGPWMEWFKSLLGFLLLWGALYFVQPVIGDAVYDVAFALLLVAAAVFLGGIDRLTPESGPGARAKRLLGTVAIGYAIFLLIPHFGLAGGAAPGTTPRPGRADGAAKSQEHVFEIAPTDEVKRAIGSGKPVVLDFWATWCVYCKQLDREVYNQPEALAAAEGLTTLKVDFDEAPDLAERYGVFQPPVLVFIGPDGKHRDALQLVGKMSLQQFVDRIEKFKQSLGRE
jgi:thiol:disulfide interchange protein DsbD